MSGNSSRLSIVAAAALIVVAGSAWASDIYKWTDSDGNVHYGDRPASEAPSERLAIASQPTDRQRVDSLVAARRDARETARDEQAAREEEKMSLEEQRQAEAEREQQCTLYKERLQQFVQSRRLYREDENGERVYLDEEETLDARNKVQQQVREYCSD